MCYECPIEGCEKTCKRDVDMLRHLLIEGKRGVKEQEHKNWKIKYYKLNPEVKDLRERKGEERKGGHKEMAKRLSKYFKKVNSC